MLHDYPPLWQKLSSMRLSAWTPLPAALLATASTTHLCSCPHAALIKSMQRALVACNHVLVPARCSTSCAGTRRLRAATQPASTMTGFVPQHG